eukprot:scaffold129728_cov36-Tisochrysis_lutea.AAC.1
MGPIQEAHATTCNKKLKRKAARAMATEEWDEAEAQREEEEDDDLLERLERRRGSDDSRMRFAFLHCGPCPPRRPLVVSFTSLCCGNRRLQHPH